MGDEGVPLGQLAEAIGQHLGLPVASIPAGEAQAHSGWLAAFAGVDNPASAARTVERFGWSPTEPGLLDDLGGYY